MNTFTIINGTHYPLDTGKQIGQIRQLLTSLNQEAEYWRGDVSMGTLKPYMRPTTTIGYWRQTETVVQPVREETSFGQKLRDLRDGKPVLVSEMDIEDHGSAEAYLSYMCDWQFALLMEQATYPWPTPTTWDPAVKEMVLDYLENGGNPELERFFHGPSHCRVCDCFNGSSERSDGTYSWPEGLTHYVRDHNTELPSEFVNHVLAKKGAE